MNSENKEFQKTVGRRIEELRKERGLTQAELAGSLGVLRESLAQWERGAQNIKTVHVVAIAKYFKVSCDFLLGQSRSPSTDEAKQALYDDTGLSDIALNELSLPEPKQAGVIFDYQNPRTTKTLMYREVVNLLLTNPHGKKALQHLADYFFVQGVGNEQALVFGDVKSVKSRITRAMIDKFAKLMDCDSPSAEYAIEQRIIQHLNLAVQELEKILPQDEEA